MSKPPQDPRPTWRPYSTRSALVRRLVPDIDVTHSLDGGLRLRANLRTHLGLMRRAHRQQEVATATAIAALAPPDGVIYDIGANIGLYTVVFARSGARRVVAFEPSTLVLPYLRQNIALNALKNVDIQTIVVSDRHGRVRFTLDPTTTCTSHVSAPDEAGLELECMPLDDLIPRQRLPEPDVIKLDVEGHDLPILLGMRRLLTERRAVICLEGGLRSEDGRIPSLTFLVDIGYRLWNLERTREVADDTPEYVVVGVPGRRRS